MDNDETVGPLGPSTRKGTEEHEERGMSAKKPAGVYYYKACIGTTCSSPVSLTVRNSPPTVDDEIPDQTLTVNSTKSLERPGYYFEDPNEDSLTYTTVSSDDPNVAVAQITNQTTVTITGKGNGNTTIYLTASDGALSATDSFTVEVSGTTQPNNPPVTNNPPVAVGTISVQTLTVGGSAVTLDMAPYFSDPDGDTLTYRVETDAPRVAIGNDELQTLHVVLPTVSGSMLTLEPIRTGTPTITVTATDPSQRSVTQTFTTTVNAATQPNNPPEVVRTIPNQTLLVGHSTGLYLGGYFRDGATLSYTATSSNSSVATARVSREYHMTITAVSAGTAKITVTANDNRGGTATQTFTVSANTRPVAVGTTPNQTLVMGGSAVTLDMADYFSDPDGDTLTYGAAIFYDGVTTPHVVLLKISGSVLTLTPVRVGTSKIGVNATDPRAGWAHQFFTVTVSGVTPPNQPPITVGTIPDKTLVARSGGLMLDVSAYFSDPDGDTLNYQVSSDKPRVATADLSGTTLIVRSYGTTAGLATITVTATDNSQASATQTFTATVNAATQPNQPPVVDHPIPDQRLKIGETFTVNVLDHFSDPEGDTVRYSGFSGNSRVVDMKNINDLHTSITLEAIGNGNATIVLQVTDGKVETELSFIITVGAATQPNQPPVTVGRIPAQTLGVGSGAQTLDVSAYFSDPDGDTLSYQVSSNNTSTATASLSGTTLTVSPGRTAGSAAITVMASDGSGATETQTFTVTVSPPTPQNRPPVTVGRIPAQTLGVGSGAQTLDVSAYFSDPDGDTLRYQVSSSRISVVRASLSANQVILTPVSAGTATIRVTATDPSQRSVTQAFTATVRPPTRQNRPPVTVGRIQNQTVVVGSGAQTLNVAPYFRDDDGDTLSYTASSSDPSVVTARLSTESDVTIRPVRNGTAIITVTASDNRGGTATQTFTVSPNNPPETVGKIPDQTLVAGGSAVTLNLPDYFRDADGDNLTYGVSIFRARFYTEDVVLPSVSGSVLTLKPMSAGTRTIVVTAEYRNQEVATQKFTVTVSGSREPGQPKPRGPHATMPKQLAVGATTEVDVAGYFTHLDKAGLLFNVSSTNTSVAKASVSGSTVTLTPLSVGSTTIWIYAGYDPTWQTWTEAPSFTLRVTERATRQQNRPPTAIVTLPDQTLNLDIHDGLTVDFSLAFEDPDGNPLTYTGRSSNPKVATVSISGSIGDIKLRGAGSTRITLTANDGKASANLTFTVTVSGKSPPVHQPTPAKTYTNSLDSLATFDRLGNPKIATVAGRTGLALNGGGGVIFNTEAARFRITTGLQVSFDFYINTNSPKPVMAALMLSPDYLLMPQGNIDADFYNLVGISGGGAGGRYNQEKWNHLRIVVISEHQVQLFLNGASLGIADSDGKQDAYGQSGYLLLVGLETVGTVVVDNLVIRHNNPVQAAPGLTVTPVAAPTETILLSNYPNPFNPETWIPYQLAEPAAVTLAIYDVKGALIRQLDLGYQDAGFYRGRGRAAHWDGRNAFGERVASGVYFYTIIAGDFTATRKMLIMK